MDVTSEISYKKTVAFILGFISLAQSEGSHIPSCEAHYGVAHVAKNWERSLDNKE